MKCGARIPVGVEAGSDCAHERPSAVRDPEGVALALDKAVLDYTTAMTRTPVVVSDALFAALREHLSPAAMVELTAMIALENYRSRFNHATGSELRTRLSCAPPRVGLALIAARARPRLAARPQWMLSIQSAPR